MHAGTLMYAFSWLLERRWSSLEEGYWIWCSRDLDEWAAFEGLVQVAVLIFCTDFLRCYSSICRLVLLIWYEEKRVSIYIVRKSVAYFLMHFYFLKWNFLLIPFQNSSKKGAQYWLLWRFEGEATLSDLMLSKDFPYNVSAVSYQSLEIISISYCSLSTLELFDAFCENCIVLSSTGANWSLLLNEWQWF